LDRRKMHRLKLVPQVLLRAEKKPGTSEEAPGQVKISD
jgi:hypothetical protein